MFCEMACNKNCLSFSLVCFNILFAISGVVFLINGLALEYNFHEQPFLDDRYIFTSDFLLGISASIFLIAIVGCLGVVKESACLTLLFSSFLILIFFLELSVGILAFFMSATTEDYLEGVLINSLNQTENKIVTADWDELQTFHECCGVFGPNDWRNYTEIPKSCYSKSSQILFSDGCLDAFVTFISSHLRIVKILGLGIAGLQLFGIALCCYLSYEIRKGYMMI